MRRHWRAPSPHCSASDSFISRSSQSVIQRAATSAASMVALRAMRSDVRDLDALLREPARSGRRSRAGSRVWFFASSSLTKLSAATMWVSRARKTVRGTIKRRANRPMYRSADPATGRRAPLAGAGGAHRRWRGPWKALVLFGIASRSARALGAAALALALGAAAGCADGADEPMVPSAPHPASTMHADLVEAKAPVAIAAETGASGGSGHSKSSPAPKVIYLVYADGKTPLPATNFDACSSVAPKFSCSFGTSLLDCQQQIQAYLDRWYADFNVIFTLTRPTSGSFYTEVVSSGGGAWCSVASKVAGVAPFLCQDLHGGVAYTFVGGAERAADRRHHRAGAGAPCRPRARHRATTTSCTPTSARAATGSRHQDGGGHRRPVRPAEPELVPDDEDRARPLGAAVPSRRRSAASTTRRRRW